jgi:hypothetical protein
MNWFKHFSNAYQGTALQVLERIYGRATGYGFYFLIVEFFTHKWNGVSDPTFRVNTQSLAHHLQVKQKSCISLLRVLQDSDALKFYEQDNMLVVEFPKLLEIRHRDAVSSNDRPAISRPVAGIDKNRKEYIIQNKKPSRPEAEAEAQEKPQGAVKKKAQVPRDVLAQFKKHEGFLKGVKTEVQEKWLELYKNPVWINQEIQKAETWLLAKNTTRKNIGAFITNWLSNSTTPIPPMPKIDAYTSQQELQQLKELGYV